MKKNFRIFGLILLAVVITVMGVFGLSSCGKDEVEQIYITGSNSPRLTYVEGQALDISKGVLTAVIDGEEILVPMTNEGVGVTGYNEKQLGSQTITVTYEGQSTTFTVNVISRISAEGFEKSYFIGDPFKKDQGKLRIAKDDATTFTVNMSADSVTVKEFDSATAGTKTVKVEYSDGTNTYNCEFNVVVYDASTVSIKYPTKTSYFTHEKELSFSGGYFTIKAGENDSIVRYVDITEEMVSGFDLSKVTEEHRTTPLKQTLTVSYLNKTFTYDITITYSGVTVIENLMPTLNGVDLTGEEINLTEAEAEAAVEAATEYFALIQRHKNLISEDDVNRIIRCAAIEINKLYLEALKDCEKTIALVNTAQGYQLAFTSKSYTDTVADLAKLKDETHGINVYAKLLNDIKTDFGDLELYGDKKVSSSLLFIPKENFDVLILAFEHIVKLYEILEPVAKGWTLDTLPTYKEAIVDAVELITKENFLQQGFSSIYNVLSLWREDNDYFEIIYNYFMYKDEELGGEEYVLNTLLKKLPLPKGISTWYSYYYNSMTIASALYQGGTQYYLKDITEFMYYYNLLLEESQKIIKGEGVDQLTIDMFELMEGNMLVNAATTYYCGYYYHAGILAESENFVNLWSSYLDLYTIYREGKLAASDGAFTVGEYADKFDAVMENLTKLSPAELYGFVSSMNFLYSNAHGGTLVLSKIEKDETTGYLNTFSLLMNAYYSQVLGRDYQPLFDTLMVAMENYALIGHKASALEDFKNAMSLLNTAYGKLDVIGQSKFDSYFEDAMKKYNNLYNAALLTDGVALEGDAQTLFNNLAAVLGQIDELNAYIKEVSESEDENKSVKAGTYLMIFALYEKANAYYDMILELGKENNDIIVALYNNIYTISDVDITLETAFYQIGMVYWKYITGIKLSLTNASGKDVSYSTYDIYVSTNLKNYLLASVDLLYAIYNGDALDFDQEYVLSVMNAFHGLDRMGINLCKLFDGTTLYFEALTSYFGTVLENDAETKALADKLIEASVKYLDYVLAKTEDSETLKAEFVALMEAATGLKNALTETDNYDAYLKEFYENYYSIYDAIVNPAPEETPAE